jgi:hypothetical protein
MQWAAAAAAHREGRPSTPEGPALEAEDLLVGILLAHPDAEGEGRVLLAHFGLTARDVLPPDYPDISPEALQHRARDVSRSTLPPVGQGAQVVLGSARPEGGGPVELYHLLGALLRTNSTLRTPLLSAFGAVGENLDVVASSYERWMATDPAGRGKVAGRELADWLRENNPRQPVDVPMYASDRIDASQDLIGIATEADAFAYLIASRDLTPPLAVGLFGDWGSGKSFLMRAVQRRIDAFHELVGNTEQRLAPVWKHITQIEFNAWEYVQGDLWAGLLERIFRALGSVPVKTSLVVSRHEPLVAEISAERLRAEAAAIRMVASVETEEVRKAVVELAEEQAEAARSTAEQRAQQLLEAEAKSPVLQALAAVWGERKVQLVGSSGAELLDALSDAMTEVRRGSSLLGPFWRNRWHIVLATAGAFAIPAVAYLLLDVLDLPPLVSLLGGLAAVVPVATTAIRTATSWSRERLAELEAAKATVLENVRQTVDAADLRVAEARRALGEVREEIESSQAAVVAARTRAATLQAQIRELTPERVFVDFADERSTDYRRHLGMLATVRQDLYRLQREIQDRNAKLLLPSAPPHSEPDYSVPNRIVLYIDDLDRCPPAKVVEVLEAVHLLLAFELFVVVVAVDSRWLSSALTKELDALGDKNAGVNRPTPQDYLEKIFQLPFWVQPLTNPGREQLIRGLLSGAVRGPDGGEEDGGGTGGLRVGPGESETLAAMLGRRGSSLRLEASQLALSPEDLRFIESLAPVLGDTPRRVKRFVNICQFLLAMRPPLRSGGATSERNVVCMLAAVNEGLPAVADELFAAVAKNLPEQLGSLFPDQPGTQSEEHAAMTAWLNAHPEWKTVPISSLAVRLETVRRLRFPSPARLRDLSRLT